MADVNWTQYRCNICLMIGLGVAAIAAGLAGWLVMRAGFAIPGGVIVFLIAWAVLGFLVDNHCRGTAHATGEGAAQDAKAADKADALPGEAVAHQAKEAGTAPPAAEAGPEHQAVLPAGTAKPADVAGGDPVQNGADFDDSADRDQDGLVEGHEEGIRPVALDAPRGGQADDLKLIKGIGPKLEQLCHELGFYHFDQIAAWTPDEVAWVDSNLEGFKGRVTRDEWVAQARVLAGGGETEFSKRADDGDVPSSR